MSISENLCEKSEMKKYNHWKLYFAKRNHVVKSQNKLSIKCKDITDIK